MELKMSKQLLCRGAEGCTCQQHNPSFSPRADLLQRHEELCAYARKIMEKKNQDYGADGDPFRNFREFGTIGILVRLSDKLARIRTWEERGQFAVDETLQDTVLDAINYLILYLAMKERG